MRTYSERLPDAFVRHLRLPRPMVVLTVRKLREAGRITKGYRHAPPPGQRDIARILLGLAAMSPTASVEHGRAICRLRGPDGSAEDAVVDIIETAAGIADRDIDLTAGEVVIGQTAPLLEILGQHHTDTYGERPLGAFAVTHFPIPSIARIAQDLLNV